MECINVGDRGRGGGGQEHYRSSQNVATHVQSLPYWSRNSCGTSTTAIRALLGRPASCRATAENVCAGPNKKSDVHISVCTSDEGKWACVHFIASSAQAPTAD